MDDNTQTPSYDLTKLWGRRFPIDQTPPPTTDLVRAHNRKENEKLQKSLINAYMARSRYAMPKKAADKDTHAE